MVFVYRWQLKRMIWQQGGICGDLNSQIKKENHITMYKPLNPTPCMHGYWKQKINFRLNSTNLKIRHSKLLFSADPPSARTWIVLNFLTIFTSYDPSLQSCSLILTIPGNLSPTPPPQSPHLYHRHHFIELTRFEILDKAGGHSDWFLSSSLHKPQPNGTFILHIYFVASSPTSKSSKKLTERFPAQFTSYRQLKPSFFSIIIWSQSRVFDQIGIFPKSSVPCIQLSS